MSNIVDTNASPCQQGDQRGDGSATCHPEKHHEHGHPFPPLAGATSFAIHSNKHNGSAPFPSMMSTNTNMNTMLFNTASGKMTMMRERCSASDDDYDSDSDEDMLSTTSDTTLSPSHHLMDDQEEEEGGEYYDDDASFDSWDDSTDDDDSEDDEAYLRAAATVHAVQTSRAMARPLSLDEITALANAAGRRGTKPTISVFPSTRCSSMPQIMTARPSPPPQHQVQDQQRMMMMKTGQQQNQQQQQVASGPASSLLAATTSIPNIIINNNGSTTSNRMKPDEKLQSLWKQQGLSTQYHSYNSLSQFFLPVQPEHIAAFSNEIVKAVRNKDLAAVQALHQKNNTNTTTRATLQCCNKFGESIVHMACRQSSPEVLAYLMHTANVSIRVCCDSGRTPLHDACWTTSPNFDIIILLLEQCPDLLKVTDKRGFTPLSYVPRDKWGEWCDFLEQNADLIKCRELP